MAGDRVFLNGTYPHNIILEILVQFGIIIGGIILITFILYWFLAIFANKDKVEQDLAIYFLGLEWYNYLFQGHTSLLATFGYSWRFVLVLFTSIKEKVKKRN